MIFITLFFKLVLNSYTTEGLKWAGIFSLTVPRLLETEVSRKESFYSEFSEQVKNCDLLNILPDV